MPLQEYKKFFVLISRTSIRILIVFFFLTVSMCLRYFLILSVHCQHKQVRNKGKRPQKKVGAPEFWCLGTRVVVPLQKYKKKFFVLISRTSIRILIFFFFLTVSMCPQYFLILSKHCQHKHAFNKGKRPQNSGAPNVPD